MHRFTISHPVDLLASLRPLVASYGDPTIRLRHDGVVRAMRTAQGPATLVVRRVGERDFEAEAYGPGREEALTGAPALLGAEDDLSGFVPRAHPVVARAAHRHPGLRMIRTGRVDDVLVATILGQRVTTGEAARSWTLLTRRWGEPAPGPFADTLRLPPAPDRLAATPYWAFAPFGVERSRAERIRSACRRIGVLQQAVDLPGEAAVRLATAVPGIGPWTAAIVLRVAAGHPDTVEVGDDGLKDDVAWALAGEPRGDDTRMLELLAPFSGHRGRVVRLLRVTGRRAPRRGPGRRVVAVDRL